MITVVRGAVVFDGPVQKEIFQIVHHLVASIPQIQVSINIQHMPLGRFISVEKTGLSCTPLIDE